LWTFQLALCQLPHHYAVVLKTAGTSPLWGSGPEGSLIPLIPKEVCLFVLTCLRVPGRTDIKPFPLFHLTQVPLRVEKGQRSRTGTSGNIHSTWDTAIQQRYNKLAQCNTPKTWGKAPFILMSKCHLVF
jgi:hypothetical protein